MKSYQAHGGTWLKVSSALATLLMIGSTGLVVWLVPIGWVKLLILVLIPLEVLAAALFTVRSYTITETELLIQRLFWKTRIPLHGLKSAQIDTDAFKKCIRTCGNCGLFSVTGFYYSKSVGAFRAFATGMKNPVVLRFEKRTVVITPSDPEAFVADIRKQAHCSEA